MVSLTQSVSFSGEAYWRRPMLQARALSEVTYRQQVERLQQEEQYRQEMMRQRQELHRRQIDLYQRLQLPSQDNHNVVSTWHNSLQTSPNLSIDSQTSHNLSSENPLYGSAPMVRNPTNSSIKDNFGPLTVDCSVEYELPDFLKVSTNEGPPLLMIQNQRNKTSCDGEVRTQTKASGCNQTKCEGKAWSQTKCQGKAWTQTKCDCEIWTRTKCDCETKTQTKLDKASATHLPATRSHLKLFKSPTLNKSQSGSLELTAKLPQKRKFTDMRNPDIGHGLKRQKMMMALTPPDLVSVAHLLETPSTYFHQPRQSIKYSHKSITLSHPPVSHSHKSTKQSLPPLMQSQSSTSHSHTMPKFCSTCTTDQPTSNAARNINWHSGRTANQQPVIQTDQQTISSTNQQPSTISRIVGTSSLSKSDFHYPAIRRDSLGIGNYPRMYHQSQTNIYQDQMFHTLGPLIQKQGPILQRADPFLGEGEGFYLGYNYPTMDGTNYVYHEYRARSSCTGCSMCRLFC